MRRGRAMAMRMDMRMTVRMGIGMGVGRNHPEMLYYNITDVYPTEAATASTRATGGVADTVNDDPGRIRSVEDDIGIWVRQDLAEVAPVRGPAAFGIVGQKLDGGFQPSLDVLRTLRRLRLNIIKDV